MKMNTKFFKYFPFVMVIVLLTHFLLVLTEKIKGEILQAVIVDTSLSAIFGVGIFIILPGLKKDSEYFAMRFIGLTTLQMLSMMTLIAVLIFGNLSEPRYWALTAITLFAFLLSVQSFLFIKEVNKK
jgi:hypothetical protein